MGVGDGTGVGVGVGVADGPGVGLGVGVGRGVITPPPIAAFSASILHPGSVPSLAVALYGDCAPR